MLFTSVNSGLCVALAVAVSVFEVVPSALALAVFVTNPAFRSDCVTL
jgi:hypothetical protein